MGGACVARERKEIESVTESGTEFEITFIFLSQEKVKVWNALFINNQSEKKTVSSFYPCK